MRLRSRRSMHNSSFAGGVKGSRITGLLVLVAGVTSSTFLDSAFLRWPTYR